jgi:hypothetical protein
MRLILSVVLGAAAGFAWYKWVGCATGACPLSSNPWLMMGYGAVLGALIGSK